MRTGLRVLIVGGVGLAIVGLIALMGWGLSNKRPVTGLSGVTRVQLPAPEFTLPLFDGGEVVLSELGGRPLVINFWNPECWPCREEASGLERTWRAYKDTDVLFVGLETPIILNSEESAKAYLSEFDVTYPNGRDSDGRITVEYGVIGVPITFFVNRSGIVERRWVGAIPEERLVAWVAELVSGAAPSGQIEGTDPERFFTVDGEP